MPCLAEIRQEPGRFGLLQILKGAESGSHGQNPGIMDLGAVHVLGCIAHHPDILNLQGAVETFFGPGERYRQ